MNNIIHLGQIQGYIQSINQICKQQQNNLVSSFGRLLIIKLNQALHGKLVSETPLSILQKTKQFINTYTQPKINLRLLKYPQNSQKLSRSQYQRLQRKYGAQVFYKTVKEKIQESQNTINQLQQKKKQLQQELKKYQKLTLPS